MKTVLIALALIGFTLSEKLIDLNKVKIQPPIVTESHLQISNPLKCKEVRPEPKLIKETALHSQSVKLTEAPILHSQGSYLSGKVSNLHLQIKPPLLHSQAPQLRQTELHSQLTHKIKQTPALHVQAPQLKKTFLHSQTNFLRPQPRVTLPHTQTNTHLVLNTQHPQVTFPGHVTNPQHPQVTFPGHVTNPQQPQVTFPGHVTNPQQPQVTGPGHVTNPQQPRNLRVREN